LNLRKIRRTFRDYSKQLDSLKAKREAAGQKLSEVKAAGEDGWESMKSGVEGAWNELKSPIDGAATKFK